MTIVRMGVTIVRSVSHLRCRCNGSITRLCSAISAGLKTPSDSNRQSVGGGPSKSKQAPSQAVAGKHPVSALQEICQKRHWNNPDYQLVTPSPFLFKVCSVELSALFVVLRTCLSICLSYTVTGGSPNRHLPAIDGKQY